MKQIPLGARGSFSLLVQPEHLANRFKDAMLPAVFATPVMIMVMENAALNAIKAYLDSGESAVGTEVDVRHLAATPVDAWSPARPRSRKSTGGGSNSECAQRRAIKRSEPGRIPVPSSIWPNSRVASNLDLDEAGLFPLREIDRNSRSGCARTDLVQIST